MYSGVDQTSFHPWKRIPSMDRRLICMDGDIRQWNATYCRAKHSPSAVITQPPSDYGSSLVRAGVLGAFQMGAWGRKAPRKAPLQWWSLMSLQVRPPTTIILNMLACGEVSNRRISIHNMAVPPGRVQLFASSFVDPSTAAFLMKLFCSAWSWIDIWPPH